MAKKLDWQSFQKSIVSCRRCPRLVRHCRQIAQTKKREFMQQSYWGKPVPGFGAQDAQIWIVGLAPGAHGANRTGRMFTGDSSGNWLYRALYETGFASQPHSTSIDDGLTLYHTYISAAARCAPPDNKPSIEELKSCEHFLDAEWEQLNQVKVMVALGKIALDAVWNLGKRKQVLNGAKRFSFAHHSMFSMANKVVLASYHPSRQNTQTGRLTWTMWEGIFHEARKLAGLKNHAASKGKLIGSPGPHRINEPISGNQL